MNQVIHFLNNLDIISAYAFYGICLVFCIVLLYYTYYYFIKPKNDQQIKNLLKKNPDYSIEDAINKIYPNTENPLKKGGIRSAISYLFIAYLMSIIAFPLSYYIVECYLLKIDSNYKSITLANKSLDIYELILLVTFDLIIVLFIVSFVFGSVVSLLKAKQKQHA